ncbi:flavin reductase family protein [Pseudomonas panipatensis]|uniref:NADH-FMN oxidoreductase RutF, flavin reductase (DIM6/NTAB) family n=1 Tax=Pseudomonas panipatensis TaxID=428992 RepID=A0A1G8I8K1_9PSED|nr:flavin reductase family protein [Pseudomonas panipatensis]SDI14880.1 NADH-FMN oxidoreductase RutF, flavin reductase (DIM6/NTAB) family [Pseudomonas panipatensis]SMP75850.1 NADH-FMN oxidoreductase RutF, flavin reductase (DIM6/NTAB) family [Pseudomonas panipatensis]
MKHLQDVPLAKAYLLLNHGPSTLVTSEHEGVANVMAAAWVMPLDFDPPKLMLVLDRNTWSRHLVEGSGAFVIQLPSRRQAELTVDVGSCNGGELNKFARYDIATARARCVEAPIIEGCLAYLECRVIDEPHNQQRYDLFIAEVVAAYADERAFSNGRWHFPDDQLRTIHYQAGGAFFATGEAFQVAKG